MRFLFVAALSMVLPGAHAIAQENAQENAPPQGAKPLSALLQTIERNADFRNFGDIEWEHGVYEVEYYTKAGAKIAVRIDPISGNPVPAGMTGAK